MCIQNTWDGKMTDDCSAWDAEMFLQRKLAYNFGNSELYGTWRSPWKHIFSTWTSMCILIRRYLRRTSEGAFGAVWLNHSDLAVWPKFPWFSLCVCVCFLTYVSQTGPHPPTRINTQLQRTSLPFYSFQNKFWFDTAKTLNLQQQIFFLLLLFFLFRLLVVSQHMILK